MDRVDLYFKQLVTQGEFDGLLDDIEFEIGFQNWVLMPGNRFLGSAASDNLEPESNRAGTIVFGMKMRADSPAAKTVGIDYGAGLVQTEDDGGTYTEQQLSVRETDLPSEAKVPMVATLGDPRQKFTSGTFAIELDMTATIAAISSSQFVRVRVYATLNRDESDPRVDGNGASLNVIRRVGQLDLEFDVGAEAASAGAAAAPTLRTTRDNIHLGLLVLEEGMTTITASEIEHEDRHYTGMTPFSGDARLMSIKSVEDSNTGVTTGTKGERVITLSSGMPIYTDINTIASLDSTVENRRAIWGFNAADGGPTAAILPEVGLFRDKILARMQVAVVRESDDDVIAGVEIMLLGATGASDIVGLQTDGTCDFRYRFHNNSGQTVTIFAHCWLEIYDNRGGNFQG